VFNESDDSISPWLELTARFDGEKIQPILKVLLLVAMSTARYDIAPCVES
jgi:hypothetical protein